MNTSASTVIAARTSTIAEIGQIASAPRLCGWLYLVCFQASLVVGTLLIAATSGERVAAAAIYAGSVSGWFGANALYRLGDWRARTQQLLRQLNRAMILLLVAGSALSLILARTPETAPVVVLILGAALLYLIGAACRHLRPPAPRPGVLADRELAGHAFVCAAAMVQYIGLSLLIL